MTSGAKNYAEDRRAPAVIEAERERAFAAIRKLYAEALPLWRVCPSGACRRHKGCSGDHRACLRRGWPLMPAELQEQAVREVARGGPRRLAPASEIERALRRYPASNFVR